MADLPATIAVLREMHDARPYAPARQRKALRDAADLLTALSARVREHDEAVRWATECYAAKQAAEAEAQKLRAERDEYKALFAECQDARDSVGYLGTVPSCITHLDAARAEAEFTASHWKAMFQNERDVLAKLKGAPPMTDSWAKERAERLADLVEAERHNLGCRARVLEAAETALVEAEERGALFDKYAYNLDAHDKGRDEMRDELLARLRHPDEALVEAVVALLRAQPEPDGGEMECVELVLVCLADALEAEQTLPEGENAMSVIDEIAAERRRQVEVEGWTAEHDDTHVGGEMAGAAACYAFYRSHLAPAAIMGGDFIEQGWPWAAEWWKPKDRRRDLIRAAALIVAEIERLDRTEQTPETGETG